MNDAIAMYILGLGHEDHATKDDSYKAVQYHLEYLDEIRIRSDQRDEAASDCDTKYYELLSNFNYQSLGY